VAALWRLGLGFGMLSTFSGYAPVSTNLSGCCIICRLQLDSSFVRSPANYASTLPYRSFDPRFFLSFPCCRSAISVAQRATNGDCLALTCQLTPRTHLNSSLLVLWDTCSIYLPPQGHDRLAVKISRFVYGEVFGPPAESLHFSQSAPYRQGYIF
jgi:hypothetical protein